MVVRLITPLHRYFYMYHTTMLNHYHGETHHTRCILTIMYVFTKVTYTENTEMHITIYTIKIYVYNICYEDNTFI